MTRSLLIGLVALLVFAPAALAGKLVPLLGADSVAVRRAPFAPRGPTNARKRARR